MSARGAKSAPDSNARTRPLALGTSASSVIWAGGSQSIEESGHGGTPAAGHRPRTATCPRAPASPLAGIARDVAAAVGAPAHGFAVDHRADEHRATVLRAAVLVVVLGDGLRVAEAHRHDPLAVDAAGDEPARDRERPRLGELLVRALRALVVRVPLDA